MTSDALSAAPPPTGTDRGWFDRRRVILWGSVLLVLQAGFLVFLAAWQHGFVTGTAAKTSSDFVSFYAAGKLALAGTPVLAYDQVAHAAMEHAVRGPDGPYQFFFYPPVYLLLCSAFAWLPYYLAYALFELLGLVPLILVMRAIMRQSGWGWLGPLFAFPAVWWTIGLGQNAFLTAALLGGFTLLLDRRSASAGILVGLLCYKPHFGLLAPVALLAGRQWRAFFAAGATVAGLVSLSVLLFGAETWRGYLEAFAGSQSVYGTGRIDYAGIVTPFGAARLLGVPAGVANAIQGVVALALAGLVGFFWFHRRGTEAARAALLLSATLLAVPLALVYDQMIALVAIGWLVRAGRDGGFLPGEKASIAVLYPLAIITWPVGSAWDIPLGPVVGLVVLVLSLRRLLLPAV